MRVKLTDAISHAQSSAFPNTLQTSQLTYKSFGFLVEIKTACSTKFTEEQINAMAAALHYDKSKKMDYEFEDMNFDTTWNGFKAWTIFLNHPKRGNSPTAEAQCDTIQLESSDDVVHRGETQLDLLPCREGKNISTAFSKPPLKICYPVGVKSEKAVKQE